ncbi:MAG: hypothetical protein ABIF11_09425 [Nitrospirota bacterium]
MKIWQIISGALLGIIIILFAYFVWPTPYKYYTIKYDTRGSNEGLVRIHRVTGDTQVLHYPFNCWGKVMSQKEWQEWERAQPVEEEAIALEEEKEVIPELGE